MAKVSVAIKKITVNCSKLCRKITVTNTIIFRKKTNVLEPAICARGAQEFPLLIGCQPPRSTEVIPRATATRLKRSSGSRKWLFASSSCSLPTKKTNGAFYQFGKKTKGMFNSVLNILGSYCQCSQFSENTEWIFEEFLWNWDWTVATRRKRSKIERRF